MPPWLPRRSPSSGSAAAAASGGAEFLFKGKGKGKTPLLHEQARKPQCLRLKGFTCHLVKKDLLEVARAFCVSLGVDKDVSECHSSAVAGSCVVEFSSEAAAKHALEMSKHPSADCAWQDPKTNIVSTLFFSFDESSELRAWGTGLRVVYDAAWKHIVSLAPQGTSLQTDKPRGVLKLVCDGRFYPIFTIDSDNGGQTFRFVERRGRFSPIRIPPFVTADSIELVKKECLSDPLFQ